MNLKEIAVRSGISAVSRLRDFRLCMGHEVYTFSFHYRALLIVLLVLVPT